MSDMASFVLYLEQLEYCQVAAATAILYDYLLTFGREVDLIWRKRWSLVSSLYVVVRYMSIPLLINTAFYMGNIHMSPQECLVVYEIRQWGQFIYRIAMDVIMILRVDAMSIDTSPSSRGSKPIYLLMVFSCIAKNVSVFVLLMLGIGPGSHIISLEGDFAGTYVCGTVPNVELVMLASVPLLSFEVLLFVLAATYFVKHVRGRYRLWNRWKVNEFMKILARDSTIYFALNLGSSALNVGNWQATASLYLAISTALAMFIPFFFVPRLVINFRDHFEHASTVHISTGEFADGVPGGRSQLSDIVFNSGPGQQSRGTAADVAV